MIHYVVYSLLRTLYSDFNYLIYPHELSSLHPCTGVQVNPPSVLTSIYNGFHYVFNLYEKRHLPRVKLSDR